MRRRPDPARIDPSEAYAWNVALAGIGLTRTMFPSFYQERVAARPATPPELLGVAMAFLLLVERKGLALDWSDVALQEGENALLSENGGRPEPESMLGAFDDVSPWFLADVVAPMIGAPAPVYYGFGVVSLFDGYDYSAVDALAATLWQMFSLTSVRLELSVSALLGHAEVDPDITALILRQRPLAPDAPAGQIVDALARRLPEARGLARPTDLVAYPFGETSNHLANITSAESSLLYDGDASDWGWDQLDELIELQRDAERISSAWRRWSDRIDADPVREIPRLARRVRSLARQVAHEETRAAARGLTLLEVMMTGEEHEREEHEREAIEDL